MTLHDILTALELRASDEQVGALQGYVELLERWSATYNLTAVRGRDGILTQHMADCLAVVGPLLKQVPNLGCLLDVGSGAGLPGVVVAVLVPQCQVTCVDAVAKKAAFVRQAAGTLRLTNLHAVHARVEELRGSSYDVITSRAFASVADFGRLTEPLLKPGGIWMAMKGRRPGAELDELPAGLVFHVEPLTVPGLNAERCLVWMRRREDGAQGSA